MPELPEVETIKRGLTELIIGKTIISENHDWAKSFPNDPTIVEQNMIGAKVNEISRRGKALIIGLSSNYSLVIHLKMTGQLVYIGTSRFGAGHPNKSLIAKLPDKSTRVTITFSDKSVLYFNDQRKFGWMRIMPSAAVEDLPFIKRLGPESLDDSFTDSDFIKRAKKRKNSTIKAVILAQSTLAGVGNIYADESLFMAGIHPARRVSELSNKQLSSLLFEIRKVMKLSIENGGSTDRNYVDARGNKGSYLEFSKVFRRQGEPCYVDGTLIVKSRVASRGTHYCPTCQKPPRGFK